MKRILATLLMQALLTASTLASDPLTMDVAFSSDDGETWARECPVLPENSELKVKVQWQSTDPDDADTGTRMVKLICTDGDFASANNGYHGSWDPKGWYQKSDLVLATDSSVVLDVNLGARPSGILGNENQWMGGRFVDGMLPACDSLSPGPHSFAVQLTYIDRDRDRRIRLSRSFTLSVADATGIVPEELPKAERTRRNPTARNRPKGPVPSPELAHAGPTLFVDVDHPQANDGNPGGSPDLPLKTIARALELVAFGGNIQIAAGTYREGDLSLRKSGTPEFPLTICGSGMDRTFLKASRVLTGWTTVEPTPDLYQINNVGANIQQVWVDGQAMQQIGRRSAWNTRVLWGDTVCLPPIGTGLGDVKPGSFYHDGPSATLYLMLPDGSNPKDHLIEVGHFSDGLLGEGTSHVVLRDLTIMQNNGTGNANKSHLLTLGQHHWTVEDCRIADGEFTGISWNGLDHTLRSCQVVRNGNTGVDMSNTDATHGWRWYESAPEMNALIEDCLFEGNNARSFYAAWHAGAMKCIPACRKVTIRRCVFRNNPAAAVWFDHAHGQIVVTDCVFENNRKAVFYEISGAGPGDSFGAFVANNRISGSQQQGVYLSASCDSFVVDNTFHDNWVNLVLHGMPRKQWKLCNHEVRNNIFGAASQAQLIVFVGDDASDNTVDGNCYTGDRGLSVGLVSGAGYDVNKRSLDELRASGFEHHGLAASAMWVDPGMSDFRLQRDSPATGKGWQPSGTRQAPPRPLAIDPTKTESLDGHQLSNNDFADPSPSGGALGWRPESHGVWKQEGETAYIHLLPGKHINQQIAVDPKWKKIQLEARIRIAEIQPGRTERDAAGFRLRFVDSADRLIQPAPHWMFRESTHGWQQVTRILDVLPDAAVLKMTVAIYCEGLMDVDFIRLTPFEDHEAESSE